MLLYVAVVQRSAASEPCREQGITPSRNPTHAHIDHVARLTDSFHSVGAVPEFSATKSDARPRHVRHQVEPGERLAYFWLSPLHRMKTSPNEAAEYQSRV